MKILGEKSFSSKVEKGLTILFGIIILLDILFFIVSTVTLFFDYTSSSMLENYLSRTILLTVIAIIFLATGIVALFIIYQFMKIFGNLRASKLFEKDNIKHLNKISISSIAIGILYFVCLISVSIILKNYISFEVLSNILIKALLFVFSIVFLVFGVGIKILNEIYKKAVEYKEENDFII